MKFKAAPDHLPVQGRQFSNEEFFKLQNAMEFEDVKGNEYKPIKRPIGQWENTREPSPCVPINKTSLFSA